MARARPLFEIIYYDDGRWRLVDFSFIRDIQQHGLRQIRNR